MYCLTLVGIEKKLKNMLADEIFKYLQSCENFRVPTNRIVDNYFNNKSKSVGTACISRKTNSSKLT